MASSSLSTSTLLTLTFSTLAYAYKCTEFFVPVTVTAPSFPVLFPPFQNHYQSVAFLDELTARNAASQPSPLGNPKNVTESFQISAEYCTPDGKGNGDVQVLSHGLGFDKSYWNFGGPGSQYNYIQVATDSGYSTLSYSRIGTGKSTKPDPYNIGQGPIEVGVLVELTAKLRAGTLNSCAPKAKGKVLHVGHSFGSILTNGLVVAEPTLSDGIFLTGYSAVGKYSGQFLISTNAHLISENQPKRFAGTSSGYLTWGDELANQYSFFHYPNFDPKVLAEAEATKWPFTVGEFLTIPLVAPAVASAFTGPVMVSTPRFEEDRKP